jgi:thioredoxin
MDMIKMWYLVAMMLGVAVSGCNGQSESSRDSEKKIAAAATVKPEHPVMEGSNSVPVHITKTEFLKLVMDYEKNPDVWAFQGEKPCLIDFYADWCGPCRISSPILDELAKEYAGRIDIYKIGVDKEQELASVFGVQSIPAFLFCPLKGKPTMSAGIGSSREDTKKMFIQQIEEILLKKTAESTI